MHIFDDLESICIAAQVLLHTHVMTQINTHPKLAPPVARTAVHTRKLTLNGYHREDGLWDIEGQITDRKAYDHLSSGGDTVPPGVAVHDMHIRLTMDNRMKILDVATSIDSAPFVDCAAAESPMKQFIGLSIGPGWRSTIDKLVGGTGGCTHVRELLGTMATAAFQTIAPYRDHLRRQRGVVPRPLEQPPPFYGKCMTYDTNGPIVQRLTPQFVGWKPMTRHK